MANNRNSRKRGSPFNLTSPGTAFTIGFIALAIGMAVLLSRGVTPSNMYSATDPQSQYQIVTEAPAPGQGNLQLKTIKFITMTPSPTPTKGGVCSADSGVGNPTPCNCVDVDVHCVGGVSVPITGDTLQPTMFVGYENAFCHGEGNVSKPDGYYCYGKPVIYLYPQKPTFVTVTLSIPGKITESIPLVENVGRLGDAESSFVWQNVLALPGGVLKYQNSYYHELYYESKVKDVVAPDNGVFLNSNNLKQELVVQGEKLGLLPNESLEFADYWFPRLQTLHTKYIFFSILTPQEKERTDKVTIQPTPDNFIEFIAYFKGVDSQFETQPFIYPKVPQRTGFTAVEWGGTISY